MRPGRPILPRVYAFWVLGQLLLGMVGLLVLPAPFASFGLKVVYLILATHHALLSAAGPGLSSALSADVGLFRQPPAAALLTYGCARCWRSSRLYQPQRGVDFIGTIGSGGIDRSANWRLSAGGCDGVLRHYRRGRRRSARHRGAGPDTGLAGLQAC